MVVDLVVAGDGVHQRLARILENNFDASFPFSPGIASVKFTFFIVDMLSLKFQHFLSVPKSILGKSQNQ